MFSLFQVTKKAEMHSVKLHMHPINLYLQAFSKAAYALIQVAYTCIPKSLYLHQWNWFYMHSVKM